MQRLREVRELSKTPESGRCLMHLQTSKEMLEWTDKGQRYGTGGRRDNRRRGWIVWGTAILRTWVSLAGRWGSSSGF